MKRQIPLFLLAQMVILISMLTGCSDVKFENDEIALFLGETTKVEVSSENPPVTYSTDNNNIATIDNNGAVTATGIGETIITATNSKGETAECKVIVSHIEPTDLKMDDSNYILYVGDTYPLSVTFTPSNTTDTMLKWTTSNANVASVDSDGNISGKNNGSAVITAESGNGISTTCTITVVRDVFEKCCIEAVKEVRDYSSNPEEFEICGDILVNYNEGTFCVLVNSSTVSSGSIRNGVALFTDEGNVIPGALYADSDSSISDIYDTIEGIIDRWDDLKGSTGIDLLDGKSIANILNCSYRDYSYWDDEKLNEILVSSENTLKNGAVSIEAIINATVEQKNALKMARSYLKTNNFSYSRLIDQLMYSGFSRNDATFAADHCNANWYMQAASKAQRYLSIMAFSRSRLIDQLMYEGFTADQAAYAASAVGY